MSSQRIMAAVVAAALGFAVPGAARAASDPVTWLEVGGFVHWLDAPGSENWSSRLQSFGGRTAPDADDDIDSTGYGAEAMLGFRIFGVDLEIGGSGFRGKEHATDALSFGGGVYVYTPLPVDGSLDSLAAIADDSWLPSTRGTIYSDFDARFDHWDGRLQTVLPVATGDVLRLEARIGALAGTSDQRTALTQTARNRFGPFHYTVQNDIDAGIDSWFVGPVLGAAVVVEPNDDVRFVLQAETGLLHYDSRLRVEQTVALTQTGGAPFRFDTHESDASNLFSIRPRLEGMLEIEFGPLLLRLRGAFQYWTRVPMVVHPQWPPADSGFSAVPTGTSHLSSADMMAVEAGASIGIAF